MRDDGEIIQFRGIELLDDTRQSEKTSQQHQPLKADHIDYSKYENIINEMRDK